MILISAILLTIGALIFTLFIRAKDLPEPEPVSPARHLEERKARIYENLRDLQFEYRVGKLSDEDYQSSKLELQRELAGVLAEIDSVLGRKQPASAPPVTPRPQPKLYTCPHCGAEFPKPMKFCGECGKPMAEAAQ